MTPGAKPLLREPRTEPGRPFRIGNGIICRVGRVENNVEVDLAATVKWLNKLTVTMPIKIRAPFQCTGTTGNQHGQRERLAYGNYPEGRKSNQLPDPELT